MLKDLFLCFFKIGAFTFGGGYAMIPLICREVAEKHKWMEEKDILEVVAIAESSPGPIAINAATFVGYRAAGFWGAFFATLGVVLPSFVIITVIAKILDGFQNYRVVRYAFFGIRAGVVALIVKAFITMYQKRPKGRLTYVVAAAAFCLVVFVKLNAIYAILICAALGLTVTLLNRKYGKNEELSSGKEAGGK